MAEMHRIDRTHRNDRDRSLRPSTSLFTALLAFALLLTACAPPKWQEPARANGGVSAAALDTLPPPAVSAITASPEPAAALDTPAAAAETQPATAPPAITAAAATHLPTAEPTSAPLPPADPDRPQPASWQTWPVAPAVSAGMLARYQAAVDAGADPRRFSVVGDCQSEPNVFLGIYDTDRYWLGDYTYLQEAIDYYGGSFEHYSVSVKDGLSAPSALSPMWADPNQCESGESPVACELRLNKPALVFINLGTNWRADASAEAYGEYLRQIIDEALAANTLPVLSTKADNIEGDHSLNLETAEVAYEYDLPLVNVWRAVQDLPDHGLDPARDGVYLTPEGWDRRNFTALRSLHALMSAYQAGQPVPAPTLDP